MRHTLKIIPFHIYVITTILCSYLFVVDLHFPSVPMLSGSTSIMYELLYFIGMTGDHRDIGIAKTLLIIIILWIVSLIVSYLIAWIGKRCLPFVVVAGANILITVLIICYAVYSEFTELVPKMVIETAVNFAYFIWMLWVYRKKLMNDESQRPVS